MYMMIKIPGGDELEILPPLKSQVEEIHRLIETDPIPVIPFVKVVERILNRNDTGHKVNVTAILKKDSGFLSEFIKRHNEYLKRLLEDTQFQIPYYPDKEDEDGLVYPILTWWEHLVYDYTGLNFHQIENLEYETFLRLRRDAYLNRLSGTEKGREYLKNAKRLTETEPDRKGLRRRYGKHTN